MFDAILPSSPEPDIAPSPPSDPVRGEIDLSVKRVGEQTRTEGLFQHAPLRTLFPNVPKGEAFQAVLTNTAGGLVGGDSLRIVLDARVDTQIQAVAQAAEKVYRSVGPDVIIDVQMNADPGSWLEWLPQETILFDGARLRRATTINLRGDARVLAGEMLVFGRTAHGEVVHHGLAHDQWDVRIDGKLVWADSLHLDGDIAARLAQPACFGGAHAAATLVLAGPGAEVLDPCLTWLREQSGDHGVLSGGSIVGGILVARWLSSDAQALRNAYGTAWAKLRNIAGGLPEALPRIWHV